jgi:collagenase-like PrtC family protease
MTSPQVELLAPARDLAAGLAAIDAGADIDTRNRRE